jgi:hypothetical protein
MDLSGGLGEEWMHGEIKKKLDLFNMNMLERLHWEEKEGGGIFWYSN